MIWKIESNIDKREGKTTRVKLSLTGTYGAERSV
jgi:hypothetical protein